MMEPGALFGADFIIRRDKIGIRLTGKGIFQRPYISQIDEKISMQRMIGSFEFFQQF